MFKDSSTISPAVLIFLMYLIIKYYVKLISRLPRNLLPLLDPTDLISEHEVCHFRLVHSTTLLH